MGTFTTTDAAELYDEVLDKLQDYCGETLYPGDERRIFAEGFAGLWILINNRIDAVAKMTLLKYASGDALDAIGDMFYETERLEAEKATTTLRYSVDDYLDKAITIPAGSRAQTADGKIFVTLNSGTIAIGSLYCDVAAEAVEGGSSYNDYLAGSVNTMTDLIAYVDAVSNLTVTTGGTDEEDDDAYRDRIRLAMDKPTSAATKSGCVYYVKSVSSEISDVCVTTPDANQVKVTFALSDGSLPDDDLIDEVEDTITADDIKGMGDQISVSAPGAVSYDIDITYYVSSELSAAAIQAIEEDSYTDADGNACTGAIEQYRLWQDSHIGRAINSDKLIKLVMDAGADRVIVNSPSYTEIADHYVAHYSGTRTVSHVIKD